MSLRPVVLPAALALAALALTAQPTQPPAKGGGTRRPAATAPAAPAGEPAAARKARADSVRAAEAAKLWPVKGPAPLPGSLLPAKRIIAYYGNPNSKRMGVLGELPQPEMFAKLDRETAAWNRADPSTPVQQALHLIAVVAQGAAGEDGKWRRRESPKIIEKVYGWAKQKNAVMFLDVQIGKSTLEDELQVLVPYLQRPDVHLGLDPEFAMTKGGDPGRRVGTYDARHINQAIDLLAGLVTQHKLPPKVLVIHRFTGPMVTNYQNIKRDPRVQVVMHMDGWGPPYGKKATWSRFIYPYPVQYTGFKLFYHNDTKAGHPLMKPSEVLALTPKPVYIQYQ
ncbi:hypothetical protein [Roseisolibacter sp. H3M3-2]|uniref:hypothetical protein n=1 Tax=Roseisolibacter sp. H3M3-2 TaxID=3031323 RepID=UPI0023D97EE9|nr:hypothetical protein [Roseisolibacter sp. H3M3-2]MDF1504815.1 hypothetical protein [Roseisolibacter sp. H3M3-2]